MSLSIAPIGRLRTGARISALRQTFRVGSTVTWFGEFRDPITNGLAAASDVEFVFLSPDGETEIPTTGIAQETGVYAANMSAVATLGDWTVRLLGDGVRVDEQVFTVAATAFDDDPVSPTLVIGPGDSLSIVVSSDLTFVTT